MRENNIDNDSEHLSDTQERDVGGLGNAAVHELNRIRAEALRNIDEGGFSWFHLKLCFVAGTGFFTDAWYDIFAINLASVMLGYVYLHTPAALQKSGSKLRRPLGIYSGQLLFGSLADIVGRSKRMYGIELMIILTSTFAQVLSGSGPGMNIIAVLIVWRFILGVGVGGDYPLSAVIASEFASTGSRGRLMTTVFTAQGWGNSFLHGGRDSILTDNLNDLKHVDYCWRILIGLGCVPGAIALYFRLTIPETPRFTMDIDRDVQRARTDIENALGPDGSSAAKLFWVNPDAVVQRAHAPRQSLNDFMSYFAQPGNLLLLFGATYSWFAIDVAVYGLGLNSSSILTSDLLTRAGTGSPVAPSDLTATLGIYESLRNVVIGSLVVCAAGLLPGYYASFFLIDVWGRRPIQFLGFAMLTVLLAILAGIYPGTRPDSTDQNKAQAFVAIYCLATFFTNFGPNVTTFIIPGEIFPTRYRSTAHGITTACEKLGAIVSQIIFFKVRDSDRTLQAILGIFAGVTLTGIGSTFLLEETKDQSLEQLSRERQQNFIHGVTQVELRNGVVHRHGPPRR